MRTLVANPHSYDREARVDHQLEGIAWALLLIMLGALTLWKSAPDDTWLIGTGVILLGLNFTRYLNGIPMRRFTLGLGVLALLLGAAQYAGLGFPALPILLIFIGAHTLLYAVVDPGSRQ